MSDIPKNVFANLSCRRKYLVGISGGCDSMVLLHLLLKQGFKHLVICHLHHGLRGRSAQADQTLVQKFAQKHDLLFLTEKVDTPKYAQAQKLSIEVAARHLRYAFFAKCAKQTRCRRLLLAHHADDQAETILFHFLRGSGLTGLCGMRLETIFPTHSIALHIYRPLLSITRAKLQEIAEKYHIPWREDPSNQSPDFTRNRLRHEAFPLLTSIMKRDIRSTLLRNAEIFRAEDDWLNAHILPPQVKLSCKDLRAIPAALQRRTILQWLKTQTDLEIRFQDVEAVIGLLHSSSPAKINLPRGLHVRRRAGFLFIE